MMRDFRCVVVACWVRFWAFLLMGVVLCLGVPPSVAGGGYTRNDSSLTPVAPDYSIEGVKQMAPIEIIHEMVRIRAAERWERFVIGTPIPAVNDDGRLVCYHVPVMPDADTFPEVLSAPPADELDFNRLGDAKLWGNDTFWTFWVSASQSDYPVFTHGPGLPPLLVTYHKAFERARELLGTDDVELVHYISLGHPGDFYRFRAPDGTTARLHAYRLTGDIEEDESVTRRTTVVDEPSEPTRQPDADFRRQVDEAWAEAIERLEQMEDCSDGTRRSTAVYTKKYEDDRLIPHVNYVENFEWIRGCTPTAAATVLSYYNSGSTGYQNLIQSYRRQWCSKTENWRDGSPDLINRLANAMGTSSSGSTYYWNIRSGIREVTRDLGYTFGGRTVRGCSRVLCPHNASDWIPGGDTRRWNYSWNYIRDEIRDRGRPLIWTPIKVVEGHSLAAVGYNSGRNEVIVIDSNRVGLGLRYWYYNVYKYDGRPCLHVYVTRVVPQEGYSAGITIVQRSRFENVTRFGGETYQFSWQHRGDDAIKTVDILLSHDNGRTWDYRLAGDIPSIPGRNIYRVTLPKDVGSNRRLRIIGFDADGVQRASDSTRASFRIQRKTDEFTVRIEPPDAREQARWRAIAADGIGTTGWKAHEEPADLWAGDYTIKFKPIEAYDLPQDRQITLPQSVNYIYGGYVPSGNRLHVPLEPPAAIAAGAQWRVKGGFTEWMNSGAWVFLDPGMYTVEFKDLPGWYRLEDVQVDLTEQGKSLSREYTKRPESIGWLRVNLYPPAVREAGARWRRQGTDRWFESGAAELVTVGEYDLEFNSVANWTPPAVKSVYVALSFRPHEASVASAMYVPHMGGLHVDMPLEQQDQGARWRIAGTEEWLDPNTTLENMPVGWHEIEFEPLEGDLWTVPEPFAVMVEHLETATNRVSYTPIAGSLRVVTSPLRASMAGARWRIEGGDGDWLRSGDVLGRLVEGDYTVEFKNMTGWDKPANQEVTIVRHETAEVGGAYTAQDLTQLCKALANCDLNWELGGDAEWFAQSKYVFEGKTAAQSGPIVNGEESWIETGVEGPGTLRFHWAVESREGMDGLRFSTKPLMGDFTIQETITGSVSWEEVEYAVPAGYYLLRWSYFKSVEPGGQKIDAGWLDRVRWLPDGEDLPDLAVTDSHATSLTVDRGETVNLSATIENLGEATAEDILMVWHLALDQHMTETIITPALHWIETLDPDGQEEWTDVTWTVPIDTEPGAYYLAAHVDPAGEIADSNPFNNRGEVFEVTITEEQRLPDLAITQSSVTPALLEPGDTLTLEATVQNEGDADASNFLVHWYASREPHVPPDIKLGYTRISRLEPDAGEQFAYYIPWTMPDNMEGGTYYLVAVADTHDDVYESNTNNNRSVVHQVYVQTEPTPPVTAGQLVTWGRQTTPNAPLRNIVALDAGPWHSMALTMDGGIIAWGYNFHGQTEPPTARDYIAIASGGEHGIALRQDGSLVGWGWDLLDQASPPAGNDYVAVAAGDTHSLALRADGSIAAWGDDFDGQATAPEGTNFVAIAAGGWHSLALRDDGSIYCWGNNDHGQVTVPEDTNFVAIAAGEWHSLALRDDGSIYCWGNNEYGLDDPPEGNQFIAIAGGREHAIAMRADGTLVGWGNNNWGQATPPDEGRYVDIAAGDLHSLALRADGTLVGWGNNWEGQSEPSTGSDYKAIDAAFPTYSLYLTSEGRIRGVGQYMHVDEQPQTAGHQAVAAGSVHALALLEQGTIVGWGVNDHGQLDIPDEYDFVAIAAAMNHSLALRKNGSIVGWGDNYYGQVSTPVGTHYAAIATGHGHSMALHENGSIYCWGNNDYGQAVPPQGNDFVAIAAGGFHSLALRQDGSIAGWGANHALQATPPAGNDFVAIAAGWDHSLALRSNGSIVEWGETYWTGKTPTPAGNDFIAIDAGQFHSVALRGVPAETWTLYVQEPQGEGTTSPAAGTGRHRVGSDAFLNATPEAGWKFSHWLVNDMFAGGTTNFALAAGESDEIVVVQAVFTDGISPPVALDNAYRVQRNQPLHVDAPGVLENDYDPHGTELNAILVEQPRHGTLTLNDDGSFTYSPDTDFAGLDTFIYEAYAGEKRSAPATVLLSVQTYTVTYTAGTGGRIVGETEQVIAEGESGSMVEVVVGDGGAVFAHWSDGIADPLRADANVTSNLNLTARFRSRGGADLGWYAAHGIAPEPGEDWTDVDDRPVEGKGTTLLHENIADTNPFDPTDTFRILDVIPGPPLEVIFRPGSPDRVYTLRAREDLAQGSWSNVPGVGPRRGSGTPTDTFSDDAPSPERLFYHVEVELP